MRRFVMSDSHGGYEAMVQCLEISGFDMEEDTLYFLGDVVDGWPETMESIDLLLSIDNLVYMLGNHDQWARDYFSGNMNEEESLELWLMQGGAATVKSYAPNQMPKAHLELLQNAKTYHITEDKILMVHAGFDISKPIEETASDYLIWSRTFVNNCYRMYLANKPHKIDQYKEVYIGHTPTTALNAAQTTPLQIGNLTLADTGAAFRGCLSIIDIDTKEVWQSDPVMRLYPYHESRNGISWNSMNTK